MINRRVRKSLKRAVARALPASPRLDYVLALPRLRIWESRHVRRAKACPSGRFELFEVVATECAQASILYLEFGVFEGRSMRWWSDRMREPDHRFIGFDTFTGLPELWGHALGATPAGAFDTKGTVPQIEDERVSFRAGLFQDTLPEFLSAMPALLDGRRLVVNLDADLYSSTLYVLTQLDPWLGDATVFFDEFSSVLGELRALEDYCAAYRRGYAALGWTPDLDHVAVRMGAHAARISATPLLEPSATLQVGLQPVASTSNSLSAAP